MTMLTTRSNAVPPVKTPTNTSTRRRKGGWRNAGWALFFLLLSAVPLIIFTFIPMGASLWVSLHKWNLISPMK